MIMPATLEKVRHAAVDACTTAASASRHAVMQSVRFLGRNPVPTICGAVALGALAAWALRHRTRNGKGATEPSE
jgi:hypothetical protein